MFNPRGLVVTSEGLYGDIAFSEPRDIDMSPVAAFQQVAAPEQAVRMKIGYDHAFVQRFRLRGCLIGWWLQHLVHPVLDDTGHNEVYDCHNEQEDEQYQTQSFHGRTAYHAGCLR